MKQNLHNLSFTHNFYPQTVSLLFELLAFFAGGELLEGDAGATRVGLPSISGLTCSRPSSLSSVELDARLEDCPVGAKKRVSSVALSGFAIVLLLAFTLSNGAGAKADDEVEADDGAVTSAGTVCDIGTVRTAFILDALFPLALVFDADIDKSIFGFVVTLELEIALARACFLNMVIIFFPSGAKYFTLLLDSAHGP